MQGGGRGDFSYQWTRNGMAIPDTERILENLAPAVYAVTLTDELGCMAETSYEVTEPSTDFVVALTQDTICSDALGGFEDGVLSVTASGGVTPYIYDWSDGCLLYTSPSPRDATLSRMPSSA